MELNHCVNMDSYGKHMWWLPSIKDLLEIWISITNICQILGLFFNEMVKMDRGFSVVGAQKVGG